MTKRVLVFALLWLIMATVSYAAYIDPNLMNATNSLPSGGTVRAVVYLEHQADIQALNKQLEIEHATLADRNRRVILALQQAASEEQPAVSAYLEDLKAKGLIVKYEMYWIANLFVVEANRAGIDELISRPELKAFYLDYQIENIEPVKQKPDQSVLAGHEQGLERINAPWAWSHGWTGQGRVVMNIDTGVDGTHPALSARFRGDVDGDGDVDESWFDPWNTNYPTPEDDGGHGTHTMGTICGRSAAGDTVGVAINAEWIAAGAIDRPGATIPQTVANAIAAFQWAADPDGNPNTQDNPDAIGNSWGVNSGMGYPACDETFWTVIDNCEAAGSAVVFSAGNEGPSSNSLRTPADRGTTPYNCFSVGAVDGADPSLPIADFSSRGPSNCGPGGSQVIKPEIVAPGVSVRSSYPGGGYYVMSGTSMASPHITGSVAILRQVNPNLSVDDIKNIFMQTATDLGSPGEDNTYGHGVINLQTAIQMAMTGFGTIDGYVRNATNNSPLPARIQVVYSTMGTDADGSGYYLFSVPAETTYTLRASYFGFLPTDHNVAVVANDTVSQDFLLSPAPTAILQGHVTSVSGDSIASATVTILNTPLPPATTDSHGFYQFTAVPTGSTYQVQVNAMGYSLGLSPIEIQNGTNTLDFQLSPSETFENSNGGYSGSGVWEWGVPTSGPNEAHSGTKLWATVLGGNYPDNTDNPLYSRDYTIISPNAALEFFHWYAFEPTYDGGNVSISTDNGSTWTLMTPEGGYPDGNVSALGGPGYSASSNWALAHFDINGYQGQTVKFKFRFASDYSLHFAGWYIDDVSVSGAGVPRPPNIGYDPTSYTVQLTPGNMTTQPLNIHNTGAGYLNFNLSTTTNNALLLDNGKVLPVVLSVANQKPIGYNPASDKVGAVAEPIYSPVLLNRGGPDLFGHGWIDSDESGGPVYNWVDISGSGTPVTLTDDSYAGPINIGFTFPFYQNSYSQLYISSNGAITLGSADNTYQNTGIPNNSVPNNFIAMWWDDLNPTNGGNVYYYYDSANQRFIVSFVNIKYFLSPSGTGSNTFEAILYPNGKVELNYGTMDPGSHGLNSATIGIENSTGLDGLQVVYNADYMHSDLAIRISSSWLSATPTSAQVAPGNSTSATISFDASSLAQGAYTGNINLDSNDPDTPNIDIPVTLNVGSGGVPNIVQTPSSLSDTLFQGANAVQYLKVKNGGNSNLTVSFADSVAWITIGTGPYSIAPGDSLMQAATLNAASLNPGTFVSHILTNSNDLDMPVISLPVTLLVLSGSPDIVLSRAAFVDTVVTGNTISRSLYISNHGNINLIYGVHDNRAWITETPDTGSVEINGADTVTVNFDATSLTPASYVGQVNVNSNDPDQPVIALPVTLLVKPQSGGACEYMLGDINGNLVPDAIDVTFGVNYLKGRSTPAVDCAIQCPGHGDQFYAAGDVNGSCEFNGIDITFFVNYLKGRVDGLLPCADCLPALPLLPVEKPIVNPSSGSSDAPTNK